MEIIPTKSLLLELVFSIYRPKEIGVIDYHGAHRQYGRENVNSVNLDIKTSKDKQKATSLYGSNSKYQNIKSEMANAYIKDLIVGAAGGAPSGDNDITETLKELFATFIPGKNFNGPVAAKDATLEFPVEIRGGGNHDINDLSSGEKEVLFGYLRLRNSAPVNSVIMLDEPELHLNPRLIRDLASFYQKHLGDAYNNQLWLVTHSDTLLRGAIGLDDSKVFHMSSAMDTAESENQLHLVSAEHETRTAVYDLVGDLATFNPAMRVIFFEGENSEFDAKMVGELFPEYASIANFISVGSKRAVRDFHSRLEKAKGAGKLDREYYSIVDKDIDDVEGDRATRRFTWDSYHIENYLLEKDVIFKVVKDIWPACPLANSTEVENELKKAAKEISLTVVRHRLEQHCQMGLRKLLGAHSDRDESAVAQTLAKALVKTKNRITKIISDKFNEKELSEKEKQIKSEYSKSLRSQKWKKVLPGRDILKRFLHNVLNGKLGYEQFRNLVLATMRDNCAKPKGMKFVLDSIFRD